MEKWVRNVTICTPTYCLTRSSFKASAMLGWCVFILFIIAVVMIFVGIFSVLGAGYSLFIRNILLMSLCFTLYICLISLFLIDILSSIDASMGKLVKAAEKSEELLYQNYLLLAKKNGKLVEQDKLENKIDKNC